MLGISAHPGSLKLSVLGRTAWCWWIGELSSVVPQAAIAWWRQARGIITVDLLEDNVVIGWLEGDRYSEHWRAQRHNVDGQQASAILGELRAKRRKTLGDHNADIILRLPSRDVLRRRLCLPHAKTKDLRRLLEFEIVRQSPVDPEHICWDFTVLARQKETKRLEVELRIVKRETIEAATALCQAIGTTPRRLCVLGDPRPADPVAFLGKRRTAPSKRLRRLMPWGAAGLGMALTFANLAAWLMHDGEDMSRLTAMVAKEKAEAHAVERLRGDVEAARQRTQFLLRQKQVPLVSKSLAEVTRLLPDGNWLFEFEATGREIRIHGYSPAASMLIGLFDGSPQFTNVRFRAPVTQGPRPDLERFDLSVDLKEGS